MRRIIVALGALALGAGGAAAAVPGAIDCARAGAADERAVCASYDLGQMDAQLATQYQILKGFLMMGGRGALLDEQRDWLNRRAACKRDQTCLKRAYRNRIGALQTQLDELKAKGPF